MGFETPGILAAILRFAAHSMMRRSYSPLNNLRVPASKLISVPNLALRRRMLPPLSNAMAPKKGCGRYKELGGRCDAPEKLAGNGDDGPRHAAQGPPFDSLRRTSSRNLALAPFWTRDLHSTHLKLSQEIAKKRIINFNNKLDGYRSNLWPPSASLDVVWCDLTGIVRLARSLALPLLTKSCRQWTGASRSQRKMISRWPMVAKGLGRCARKLVCVSGW